MFQLGFQISRYLYRYFEFSRHYMTSRDLSPSNLIVSAMGHLTPPVGDVDICCAPPPPSDLQCPSCLLALDGRRTPGSVPSVFASSRKRPQLLRHQQALYGGSWQPLPQQFMFPPNPQPVLNPRRNRFGRRSLNCPT